MTAIEVRLTPGADGGTVLTLDHVGHVDDAFWTEFGPGAVGIGWESGLLGLAGHLGAPGVPNPDQGAAWMASPEGRRFVAASRRGVGRRARRVGRQPGGRSRGRGPDRGGVHRGAGGGVRPRAVTPGRRRGREVVAATLFLENGASPRTRWTTRRAAPCQRGAAFWSLSIQGQFFLV